MRNVEVKAKVKNILSLIEKARSISKKPVEEFKQTDHFYNVSNGRLKLRIFDAGNAQLIYYDRPDTEGPKLSSYEKTEISADNVEGLHKVLCTSLGAKITVKKLRKLFIVDQTRVHVDTVDGLGDFMELEVMLSPDETPEQGEQVAFQLMETLGINKSDLMSGAYADMLSKLDQSGKD